MTHTECDQIFSTVKISVDSLYFDFKRSPYTEALPDFLNTLIFNASLPYRCFKLYENGSFITENYFLIKKAGLKANKYNKSMTSFLLVSNITGYAVEVVSYEKSNYYTFQFFGLSQNYSLKQNHAFTAFQEVVKALREFQAIYLLNQYRNAYPDASNEDINDFKNDCNYWQDSSLFRLNRVDIDIDIQEPFQTTLAVIQPILKRGERLFLQYETTAYLQKKRTAYINLTIYDKQEKNKLENPLTRLEFGFGRIFLNPDRDKNKLENSNLLKHQLLKSLTGVEKQLTENIKLTLEDISNFELFQPLFAEVCE